MIEKITVHPFKIAGISVRTTNQHGRSATDMTELWRRFYAEDISSQISNKISDEVYSVYTDYELDYTAGYTAILGYKVANLNKIPSSLERRELKGGNYVLFKAIGKIPDSVMQQWQEIWDKNKELQRLYTADFEVYGEKSNNPSNAEVDIYIATS